MVMNVTDYGDECHWLWWCMSLTMVMSTIDYGDECHWQWWWIPL